ncbi:MAG: FAD-linked oxidase C-terminal domain-containing protein [Pseudomonadota bacterium]
MAMRMLPGLERRLKSALKGEIMFDGFSRGRYATDASIYQMMPLGVVVPETVDDVRAAISIAREEGVPVLPRGGGTSQAGQTVNEALVVDNSKHLRKVLELDVQNRRCVVEPGIVLDDLNRQLKPHGLWFPVDVSTASRATIGGMAANNSCGGRSIRYGTMRDNVLSIDAILADDSDAHFGSVSKDLSGLNAPIRATFDDLLTLGSQQAGEIRRRFPDIVRRVGGYNLDVLAGRGDELNFSHLLVGSEGTLAYSTAIELKLSPIPQNKVMGVCHFPTFYKAMDASQHIVKLKPTAVELVDDTMIGLARDIDIFRPVVEQFVNGEPAAVLLVEFAEEDQAENLRRLEQLHELMGDLGFSWRRKKDRGGVVDAIAPGFQGAITEVRKSGLNIMMSMKSDGKPVSFVEDCAVELKDLAEYTSGLNDIFRKYGTNGTWYAHASVGCLHVRPVLNLKLEQDVSTMRAIAEEAFDLVLKYKGSHSGEHGDGIVRSEFHEKMFGSQIVGMFGEVKRLFDPDGLFNPGKIVDPPAMSDRTLLRYKPDYSVPDFETAFDWSAWRGAGGGFQGAVEMCNNNGACRKLAGGVMCPSYRATRNERDVTRGRANTLRLALSGQLGEDAFTSGEMGESLKLCVSCKACKRECPTGVDMARMKIEVQSARVRKHGLNLHDRLIAYLPRYAPMVSKFSWAMNLRNRVPILAALSEGMTGFAAGRKLPAWSAAPFKGASVSGPVEREVVLLADTFNRYFEPQNLRAAETVLKAGGFQPIEPAPHDGGRPLCCGRTFLAAGLIEEARAEAARMIETLAPYLERGVPVVGLEPSCLLTLRDELPDLMVGPETKRLSYSAQLFEEFVAEKSGEGLLPLDLKPVAEKLLLHGHCHQKAHDVMGPVEQTLALIPDAEVETVTTSCCGMAGAFGYGKDTAEVSMQMAELNLLPAVRAACADTIVVADGTSCRHQIKDGAGREALHVARVLEMALAG